MRKEAAVGKIEKEIEKLTPGVKRLFARTVKRGIVERLSGSRIKGQTF